MEDAVYIVTALRESVAYLGSHDGNMRNRSVFRSILHGEGKKTAAPKGRRRSERLLNNSK